MNSAFHLPRSALEWHRETQAAADTTWPHTDGVNVPMRRAFKIPLDKPIAK